MNKSSSKDNNKIKQFIDAINPDGKSCLNKLLNRYIQILNYSEYTDSKIKKVNKENISYNIQGLSCTNIIIDDPLNFNDKQIKENVMFETSKGVFEGTREEVLNELKKNAKSGCNKCFGRGYIGYKEDKKTGVRQYISCKCIDRYNS